MRITVVIKQDHKTNADKFFVYLGPYQFSGPLDTAELAWDWAYEHTILNLFPRSSPDPEPVRML